MLSIVSDPPTLMARITRGEATAFDALARQLQRPMLALATRILNDRGDAEDALQTALTRLWTEAARYDPTRGSVEGWFRRILVNLCLDRRRSIRPVQPLDSAAELASSAPDPFENAHRGAQGARVAAAMAQLTPRQRAAIALFHGEGATMAEIAAALDTTPKAVEGLLARARKDLSGLLLHDRADMTRHNEDL